MIVDDFAHWHVASGDIDPVYPVLKCILQGMDSEDQCAFVLLYVAYYNLPSTVRAWGEGWRPGEQLSPEQLRYGTGVERRAHRDVRQFAAHMDSLNRHTREGVVAYFYPQADSPWTRWQEVQRSLGSIHGNGRWAGYKAGEIFDTVLGWGCPPPDAGHANSSGPRKGLRDIFPETAKYAGNSPGEIATLDDFTELLVTRWGIPVAQVETVLCDWHSVTKGNYYVGHDIDLMLEQAKRTAHIPTLDVILTARAKVFDEQWLGERQGWPGVRRGLKRLYVDTGRIDWWT